MNQLTIVFLLAAVLLASKPAAIPQVASDEERIRLARAESNRAIARHDVPGIVEFLAEDFHASASNGSLLDSRAAMGAAFAARFAEFDDAVYERTPESVEVSATGLVGAEIGRWVGWWTTPGGPFRTGGRYVAHWRKLGGAWKVHSELFVPLFCEGPGCG